MKNLKQFPGSNQILAGQKTPACFGAGLPYGRIYKKSFDAAKSN